MNPPAVQHPGTIDELEAALVQAGGHIHIEVIERHAPGLYMREVHVPAGILLTSMVHKLPHFYILSQGEIAIIDEQGKRHHLRAPAAGVTEPGTRRAVLHIKDTVWTTIHANPDNKDISDLFHDLVETPDNPLLPAGFEPDCLKSLPARITP